MRSTARRSRRTSSRASSSGTSAGRSPARSARRRGASSSRDGGTLFLDEIGEMPARTAGEAPPRAPGAAVRARRRQRRPIDRRRARRSPRRIATSRTRSQRGTFREDLYYRLNGDPDPACRRSASAREDIPLLVEHFVEEFDEEHGQPVNGVTRAARRAAARLRVAGQRARAQERDRASRWCSPARRPPRRVGPADHDPPAARFRLDGVAGLGRDVDERDRAGGARGGATALVATTSSVPRSTGHRSTLTKQRRPA